MARCDSRAHGTSLVDLVGSHGLTKRKETGSNGVMAAPDDKKSTLHEFRTFILRGNVVDLAVAVAVGAAFTAVVTSFVAAFITPIIGAFLGKDFRNLAFAINGSKFQYGLFINALVTFLITATVVFFFVVKPIQSLIRRLGMSPPEPAPTAECPACLSEIPVASSRCRYCTSELAAEWAAP